MEVDLIQNFDGKAPQMHETSWVHDGAWVIGDVVLGEESSVWPTAVLRGDMKRIVVGDHTNIQDGSIVHTTDSMCDTVIGHRVTVGHRAVLHSCIVEDDCLIGMGAIILDGAVIGKGSIVGAGALVTPTQVPPRDYGAWKSCEGGTRDYRCGLAMVGILVADLYEKGSHLAEHVVVLEWCSIMGWRYSFDD